jgi:hypothetical protein
VFVHHSKIGGLLTALGQNLRLPHRTIGIRFTPDSGIDSRSQALPSRAITGLPAPQQICIVSAQWEYQKGADLD